MASGSLFLIPKRIRRLRIADLPTTKRLEAVLRVMRVRTLGDLHRRSRSEMRKYKNCGKRTVRALEHLIERAASGEFDKQKIKDSMAPALLLKLIESAIADLPDRDRRVLLQRIGVEEKPPQTLEKIGEEYGLTKERVRQILAESGEAIRKRYGSRIPKLLRMLKQRCLESVCPLTPELLAQWTNQFQSSLGLSMSAFVWLISDLDREIPCWPDKQEPSSHVEENVRRLGLDLRKIVNNAGGAITLAAAYRRLIKQPAFAKSTADKRHYRTLRVGGFLAGLQQARLIRTTFEDPQRPIIRLGARGRPPW